MKIVISLLIVCVASLSTSGKAWRGLTPLRSTRADVERLIGAKMGTCGKQSCLYDLADETVFVLYADEPTCANDDATTSWKVPRDTIIEINVHFKTARKLSDLGFDLAKFERYEDKEVLGWVYYTNRAEGVEIEGSNTTASGISYFQSAADNNLRCPNSKPTTPNLLSTKVTIRGLNRM